jgi:hypothetical protein
VRIPERIPVRIPEHEFLAKQGLIIINKEEKGEENEKENIKVT